MDNAVASVPDAIESAQSVVVSIRMVAWLYVGIDLSQFGTLLLLRHSRHLHLLDTMQATIRTSGWSGIESNRNEKWSLTRAKANRKGEKIEPSRINNLNQRRCLPTILDNTERQP